MKHILASALCMLTGFGATAQMSQSNQQWVQYYNQTRLNDKWTLNFDTGYRWKDKFATHTLYIARTGMTYNLNNNWRITAGVAHLGFHHGLDASDLPTYYRFEHRPYQELFYGTKWGNVQVVQRIRLEQRFFQTRSFPEQYTFSGGEYRTRYRYRLAFTFSLFNMGQNAQVLFNLGNEIFVQTGHNANFFDQNRILAGPAVKFNNSISLNLIYSGQFTHANGNHWTHVVWLSVKHKIDTG